jgi:hypothetical protein
MKLSPMKKKIVTAKFTFKLVPTVYLYLLYVWTHISQYLNPSMGTHCSLPKKSGLAEKSPNPLPRSLATEQGPFCQDPFSFGKERCAPVEEFKKASNYYVKFCYLFWNLKIKKLKWQIAIFVPNLRRSLLSSTRRLSRSLFSLSRYLSPPCILVLVSSNHSQDP